MDKEKKMEWIKARLRYLKGKRVKVGLSLVKPGRIFKFKDREK